MRNIPEEIFRILPVGYFLHSAFRILPLPWAGSGYLIVSSGLLQTTNSSSLCVQVQVHLNHLINFINFINHSHSVAHLLQSCCAGVALFYRHCPRLLAGTMSPCVDTVWPSSASFLFWWQTLSSPCKHLDYAASCILSCCSFYLEFTSLADSIVTKKLHAFALQAAKLIFFSVVGLEALLS